MKRNLNKVQSNCLNIFFLLSEYHKVYLSERFQTSITYFDIFISLSIVKLDMFCLHIVSALSKLATYLPLFLNVTNVTFISTLRIRKKIIINLSNVELI